MPFLLDPTSLVMFPMQRRHPNITIVGQMMYREILTLSKETTSAMVGVIDADTYKNQECENLRKIELWKWGLRE